MGAWETEKVCGTALDVGCKDPRGRLSNPTPTPPHTRYLGLGEPPLEGLFRPRL